MLDKLYEAMLKLEALSTELQNIVGPVSEQVGEMDIKDGITYLQYVEWQLDTYEDMIKMLKSMRVKPQQILHDKMQSLQLDEMLVNGERWKPIEKRNFNCSAAAMEGLMGWTKATDNPLRESIKESIHPKTLESWANGVLDSGGTLPPFITCFEQPTVKSTKVKEK